MLGVMGVLDQFRHSNYKVHIKKKVAKFLVCKACLQVFKIVVEDSLVPYHLNLGNRLLIIIQIRHNKCYIQM